MDDFAPIDAVLQKVVERTAPERAAAELTEAGRLSSDDRYSSIARLKAVFRYSGMSKFRASIDATYIAGLRKAGMPEE